MCIEWCTKQYSIQWKYLINYVLNGNKYNIKNVLKQVLNL